MPYTSLDTSEINSKLTLLKSLFFKSIFVSVSIANAVMRKNWDEFNAIAWTDSGSLDRMHFVTNNSESFIDYEMLSFLNLLDDLFKIMP